MAEKRKFSSLGGEAVRTPDHSGHVAKKSRPSSKKAHRRQSGADDGARHFPTTSASVVETPNLFPPPAAKVTIQATAQTPSDNVRINKQPQPIPDAADLPEPPAGLTKNARKKWRQKLRQSLGSVQGANASPAASSPNQKLLANKSSAHPVDDSQQSAPVNAVPQRRSAKPFSQPQQLEPMQQKAEQHDNDILRRASTTALVPTPQKQWNARPESNLQRHAAKTSRGVDRACQTDLHGQLHLNIVFEEPQSQAQELPQPPMRPTDVLQGTISSRVSRVSAADDVSTSDTESESPRTGKQKLVDSPAAPRSVEDTRRLANTRYTELAKALDEQEDDVSIQNAQAKEISQAKASDKERVLPATGANENARAPEHDIIEISSGAELSSEYVSTDDEHDAVKDKAKVIKPKTLPPAIKATTPSPAIKPQAPSSSAKFTSRTLLDHPLFSLTPALHQTNVKDVPPSTSSSKVDKSAPMKMAVPSAKLRDDSPSSANPSLFAGIRGDSTIARLGTQGFGPIVKSAAAQKAEAARKAAKDNDKRSAFERFSSFVGGDESSDESESEEDSESEKERGVKQASQNTAVNRVKTAGPSTPARSALSAAAQKSLTGNIREANNARASQQLEQEAEAVSQPSAPIASTGTANDKLDEDADSSSSDEDDEEDVAEAESSDSDDEEDNEISSAPLETQGLLTTTKTTQSMNGAQHSAALEEGSDSDSEVSEDDSDGERDPDAASDDAEAHVIEAGSKGPTPAPADSSATNATGQGTALSSRVEVPATQDDDDAAALLDGYSEDEEDLANVQAGPSRTPTTSAATLSRQEQPDSQTSISAFSEHLDSSKKDSHSFLGRRLGGVGSQKAPSSELPDADTPSKQLTFAASEDEDDIYNTIDEVTEGVFNATRALPSFYNLSKSGPSVPSAVRRRQATDVCIPRLPQEAISCYAAQVFDGPTPDASQIHVIHDSLPLPDRTNAKDVNSALNTGLASTRPSLPNGESSSSLSDLGATHTPPASPIVRDFAHGPISPGKNASLGKGASLLPVPKKRRKMTGSKSKHFTPDKRSKREREREDDNNQLFSDMLADDNTGTVGNDDPADPHTPGPKVTPVKPTPKTKRKTTGKKSDHFLPTHLLDRVDLPSPSKGQGRPPAGVSRALIPPITSERFGIIQEKLWEEPFWLLIATIFLNQTTGRAAVPVFWAVKARYGSPELLAKAEFEEVLFMIAKLGLQNQRAKRLIKIAEAWVAQPPVAGTRYKTKNYPMPNDHVLYNGRKVKAIEEDAVESKGALEIGYLPGLGPYAWDSWRIFCRDVLRGVAEDYNSKGAVEGFQPEWQRVVPLDKELRATLRWMWLREGYIWDHFTGDRRKANEEEMDLALKGEMDVADEKEKVFAARAAGVEVAADEAAVTATDRG